MSPYMAFDGNPVFWADPSGADAIIISVGVTFTGVYMIYRDSVQGTRQGTTLITSQLDVYDVSTAKFLGRIFHSY